MRIKSGEDDILLISAAKIRGVCIVSGSQVGGSSIGIVIDNA